MDATGEGTFVVEHRDGAAHVAVTGELDIAMVRAVASDVDRLLATEPTTVVLDLGELEFIDSSGIALLLRIHSAVVQEREGVVKVETASAAVRRTFELCGLVEAFGVE